MSKWLILLLLCSQALAQSQLAGPSMVAGPSQIGGASAGGANNLTFTKSCNHNVTVTTTAVTIDIGSTGTCSSAANPVAGHLAFVYIAQVQSGTPTAADTLTNSWSCGRDATTAQAFCYSVLTTGGSADTVTVTCTSNSGGAVEYLEFGGPNATPLDAAATYNSIVSGTSWTMPSYTSVNANDVIISCGQNFSTNNTYTAGSGYTIPTDGQVSGGNQSGFCEYQIVSVATTYVPTATVTSAMTGTGFTVGFKSS